jgi:hypothetical protein
MHKNQWVNFSGTALASILAAGQVQAQTVTFNNTASWNGSAALYGLGTAASGANLALGEDFQAPSLSSVSLNSFTFYMQEYAGSGNTITIQADIYSWNGNDPTGSPLFSQNLSVTDDGAFQAVTATTGGLTLTPGGNYIALFTTIDPTSAAANGSANTQFAWEHVASSTPAIDGGGSADYFLGSDYSQLTSGTWGNQTPFAWQATFNAVPEPSTIALAGLGVSALLLRRKQSKK